jgi:hypothetical protein
VQTAQPGERWTLWVKRTDVQGARYAEIEDVDCSLTVSKLIVRWVSEEKLDVRPSLVSLRLVPCAPGDDPSEEQELAATALSPRRTLRDAGIAHGSSLRVDFCLPQGSGAVGACCVRRCLAVRARITSAHLPTAACAQHLTRHAAPAMRNAAEHVRPTFVQLLAQGGFARPLESILRLIELRFAPQANAVSDPAGAVHLYNFVKTLPGTRTKAAFAEQVEITVGGPLFPEHASSAMGLLLSGTHVGGRSVVVKVLYAANATSDGEPLEAQVCRELSLQPWDAPEHAHFLVRATVVHMDIPRADAHTFARYAIVMQCHMKPLAELAQLSFGAVAAGCARLRAALDFMHSRGILHCDVKSANVLTQVDGSWLLSDFGSCAREGDSVTSATEVFHPTLRLGSRDEAGRPLVMPATPALDWQLLFCLLLVEVGKADWKARLIPPGWGRVSERAMRGAYDELLVRADATEEMRSLARALNAQAYNF